MKRLTLFAAFLVTLMSVARAQEADWYDSQGFRHPSPPRYTLFYGPYVPYSAYNHGDGYVPDARPYSRPYGHRYVPGQSYWQGFYGSRGQQPPPHQVTPPRPISP
jgi:hypothetical protein